MTWVGVYSYLGFSFKTNKQGYVTESQRRL